MIGFNGGLIGTNRETLAANSVPGVWTLREQEIAQRQSLWPGSALLDIYTGATAAYSLRNIRSAAGASPVVKVRRSSGSPSELDFTAVQVANGELATWVGAGVDGFVTTWYDQSGTGNHAVQTNTALQPKIVTSGALETDGGKPAILFGAANGVRLIPPDITTAAECAFFFVSKHVNSAGVWSWIVGEKASGQFFIGKRTGTAVAHLYFAGMTNADVAGTDIAQKAVSYWQQGSSIAQYKINSASGTLTNGSASNTWVIGSRSTIITEKWVGTIQECIYYPASQVSTNSAIIANINAHYGIF